ncbi:MAG: hypothetical protein JXR52_08705 [Bacteroidales bacterium]|nr:hypothetical protein [Bacteroidales bacterium]MBN2698892.1 hypothetical protein [Bacteroidales bacterium]
MKRIIRIFVFLLLVSMSSLSVRAQVYTLPIENQEEFLKNTSKFNMRFFLGVPFKIPVSENGYNLNLKLEIGYKEKTIQFKDNFIFEDNSGILEIAPDLNPDHSYPDKFFKNGYSKLKGNYIYISPQWVFFSIRDFLYFTTGPYCDIRVGSRHIRKWYEDDEKMKTTLKGNELLELSNVIAGWEVSCNIFGIGIYYQYDFNNFFQDAWAVDMKYHSFGLIFGF